MQDDGLTIWGRLVPFATYAHFIIGIGTTIYLTFFDGYIYNGWNWIIALPVNLLLGQIWPVYWGLLRWVM